MTRAVSSIVLKVKSTLVRPMESVLNIKLTQLPSTANDTHDQWRPSKRFQDRSNSTTMVVCLVTIGHLRIRFRNTGWDELQGFGALIIDENSTSGQLATHRRMRLRRAWRVHRQGGGSRSPCGFLLGRDVGLGPGNAEPVRNG